MLPRGLSSPPGSGSSCDVRPPPDPRGILTSLGVAVYDWDLVSDRIVWAANAADVLGLPDLSAYSSGQDFASLVEPGSGPTRPDAVAAAGERDGGSGVPFAAQYRLRLKGDRLSLVEDTGRWYAGADGKPAFAHGILRVTAADAPAGFAEGPGQRERSAFLRAIAGDVTEAARSKRPFTLFVISIENLSSLNDELGFDGGDAVIATVLARMRIVMRRRDSFARYSGNRFALALRSCAPEQARIAASRIEQAIAAEPIETPKGPVAVRLMIGAATAPDHALEPSGLLRRAEQSLAVAKRRAGAPFVLYDPQIFRTGERRINDPSPDVIGLLNARKIVLACQPVVDATTRAVSFHEALLRVEGENGRIVNAADVVPAMERSGLVPLVDMRILELAVAHLGANPDDRLSINLSPLTLDAPDWLATLAAHVGSHPGIAPRLIIEVTETVAIRDPDGAKRKLDAMKALGVALAIDDFGAGHTSFKHLRNFPVDLVKIDGAFVQNLSRCTNDRFFVQTLIELAHHLGLAIVAEWVEDEETARLLTRWGADFLQGDHCGLPTLRRSRAAEASVRFA